MKIIMRLALFLAFVLSSSFLGSIPSAHAEVGAFNRSIGFMVLGSVPLVDTNPVVDPGIGGGLYFDYRFNQRFSLTVDAFAITQDGTGTSGGEGDIQFLGIPTATFKIYFIPGASKFDPYFGVGLGFYVLTEGAIDDNSFGVGLGAQVAIGFDYYLSDAFSLGFEGTYRTVGLINGLSGTANATTYMPYTLMGKLGYHF